MLRNWIRLTWMMAALVPLTQLAMAQDVQNATTASTGIVWPEGKRVAVSLSFDDGRPSQIDNGLPLFSRYGAAVTYYVVPGAVEQRLDGWKEAVAAGHEIGNHSNNHPCSGNFPWARDKALESYTLETMRAELVDANQRIEALLDVTPQSFAYPCGQTFVGRGRETRSYVPLIAELFTSGRGWLDEAPNDPGFVDMAQVLGVEMDGLSFPEVQRLVEDAREAGAWLVLAGHEIGTGGRQTTYIGTLEQFLQYAQDPANGIWLAPVGTVARHILEQRNNGTTGASHP